MALTKHLEVLEKTAKNLGQPVSRPRFTLEPVEYETYQLFNYDWFE
jgi:hypothetical protein